MKVLSCTPLKKKRFKYLLVLENSEYEIHAEALLVFPVNKDEISEIELLKLLQEDEFIRARIAAACFKAGHARSRKEIAGRLVKKNYPQKVIQRVLEYFSAAGDIDDEACARKRILRMMKSGKSLMEIRRHLSGMGLAGDQLGKVMKEIPEEYEIKACSRLAEKKNKRKNDGKLLARFLRSRGFSSISIKEALRNKF
ncbi:MAG: hypothetical protein A2096_16700 [Spirochaetes bacterium GWF1_41_5]|nr:MAG: hypothetical protein A2096_16700 [Spirochaetes bacterium GWF1_41_5]HBE03207.1 hypothetical protein [Spirochaetia bacterium]